MGLLDYLSGHPWQAAAAVALLALVVYALVKRLLKFALLALLVLAGLVAWFRLTGREVPEDVDQLARQAGKAAHSAVAKSGELIQKGEQELDKSKKAGD
jgi:hypothetical protein